MTGPERIQPHVQSDRFPPDAHSSQSPQQFGREVQTRSWRRRAAFRTAVDRLITTPVVCKAADVRRQRQLAQLTKFPPDRR